MEEFSILYIVIFLILSALAILLFMRNTKRYKPSAIKKEELIKKYEYEMLKLISQYEKDKSLLQEKKIEFLKTASFELHNNIFFDEHEAKAIIQKLASF
ncbi:MAG: hypothetical protein C0625_05285 [Arcobacter sp.]|nr:MAG: hypothetical protein C0625_05285 [Arcobacter sp.]